MATGYATVGIDGLKKNWGWAAALGVALIVLGMIAMSGAVLTTMASVMVFGWLLIIGGALELAHGFVRRAWSGFFLDVLTGVLYLVVGFMFLRDPAETALTLTLMLALALMFVGIMRIIVAVSSGFQHWVWLLLNGIITLVLGILILNQWPESGLWVIGLFIGIDMIFYGWALVMLAVGVRNLPSATA
jgi:uncharacterized membrane protein HdeD (DUF308 family)